MKNLLFALSILALLFSCTEEPVGPDGRVTGITLDRSTITIREGESAILVATVKPEDADNKNVSWASSDVTVVLVDNGGKVTGIKAGSATVTAKTEDGGKTASCVVTVEPNLAASVTVDTDRISAISAVLKGKANLGSTVASDLKMGIMWSKNAGVLPSNSTKTEATNMDLNYNYSVDVAGLDPLTTYYYRSYVTQNGQDTYGETKEFKTKEVSSVIQTQDAAAISAVSAKLGASLNLTDVQYTNKSFGFYWGTSAESLGSKVNATEGNDAISADLSTLNPSKQYYFQVFASFDGKELKESVKSFTTKDIESILETRDASGIEATTATLNAKLDLTDVKYSNIDYGFYWGFSESNQNEYLYGGDLADNAYSASLADLFHETQYWYKAYVKLDNQAFYGEVKTFTTDVVKVESVTLDRDEYTFNTIGDILALKATVLPADATDKSVEWSSDKADVATVDQSGRVTAKGNGTATITVTTKDQGKTASCAITVAQFITGLALDKYSLSLNEGEEYTLTPTITPSNAENTSLTWTSSNESVATVDQAGKVTAVSKGTATIKAEARDGSGANVSCSLTVIRLVSSIELDRASFVLYTSRTETITATVNPADANNTGITWSSSDTSIATVSSSGVVYGRGPGNVTITAKAKDASEIEASCVVEVRQSIITISGSSRVISLNEGEEFYLNVTVRPDNAYNRQLKWTSSNNSIATVDDNGKVTAVSKGSATIKVETQDGSNLSLSFSINVIRLVSSIELDNTSFVLYSGKTGTIIAAVRPEDANNTKITWSSSNPSIATVSSSGVVTGLSEGSVTIKAKAEDASGVEASCIVEVRQSVTGIDLDKTTLDLLPGETWTLTASVSPANAFNKDLEWSIDDETVASLENGLVTAIAKGKATIIVSAKDDGRISDTCSVVVSNLCPVGAVDMGTHSPDGYKVFWAKGNLSSSGLCAKSEEYGDYYSWGETEPRSGNGNSWSTYKWCNGSKYSLTKYNTQSNYGDVDNKTVLEAVDDAAHIKLGGKWRMPTIADWKDLLEKCDWVWITQNDINGYLVTSANGNSIFLPAPGYQYGSSLKEAGAHGYYWSSSLYTYQPHEAYFLSFTSKSRGRTFLDRSSCYSVRPVSD